MLKQRDSVCGCDIKKSSHPPALELMWRALIPESVKLTPDVIFHNQSSFCIVGNLFYNQVTDFFSHILNSLTQRSVKEEISPKQFAAATVENYFAIKKHFEPLLPIHWLSQSKVSKKRFFSLLETQFNELWRIVKVGKVRWRWKRWSWSRDALESLVRWWCNLGRFNKCFLIPSIFNFPPTTVEDFVRWKNLFVCCFNFFFWAT